MFGLRKWTLSGEKHVAIDVFWTFDSTDLQGESTKQNFGFDLTLQKPELVTTYLNKTSFFKSDSAKMYSRCPGYAEYFKNTYVIRSPSELNLVHSIEDQTPNISCKQSQYFYDNNLEIKAYEKEQQVVQLNWFWWFFTAENVEIQQLPPFFGGEKLNSKATFLSGQMNISKWFRAIQPAFIMNEKNIDISIGDPLFFIKFNTSEKINFKHFNMTSSIKEYSNSCVGFKRTKENMSLKRLYALFANRNYNKKIISEINKNLTGDF